MGNLSGHVLSGLSYLLIGLWQLINHVKLHARNPNSYSAVPFFPIKKSKYGELYFMMIGSTFHILMELFIGPSKHQPLDTDGTISTTHLHTFEHALTSLNIFTYAAFALILDRVGRPSAKYAMTLTLGAVALCQQYILLHLHSTDHTGLEGHYHWFLQILILLQILTTVLGIAYPESFLISFVRSFSVAFEGVWYIVMGIMLWTKGFVPKGCFLDMEKARYMVKCGTKEALERAKGLTTLEFSWYLTICVVLVMYLYLWMTKVCSPKANGYELAPEKVDDFVEKKVDDVETQKQSNKCDV